MKLALTFLLGTLATLAFAKPATAPIDEMLARFEVEVVEITAALAKRPDDIELLSKRGDANLFLGRTRDAVADFEQTIALNPALDAPHWRLGIAYYFNGNYAKSAQQFVKYQTYESGDRENGIWKFLAQAKEQGIEKARAEMLEFTRFDREPFPALYEMFAGRKTADELFAELETKKLGDQKQVVFFANYYAGVNEALLGNRARALELLRKAVATFSPATASSGGPGYMWQAARVHLRAIENESR